MTVSQAAPGARERQFSRLGWPLFLFVLAITGTSAGCVDLTEPWNEAETASGAGGAVAADAPVNPEPDGPDAVDGLGNPDVGAGPSVVDVGVNGSIDGGGSSSDAPGVQGIDGADTFDAGGIAPLDGGLGAGGDARGGAGGGRGKGGAGGSSGTSDAASSSFDGGADARTGSGGSKDAPSSGTGGKPTSTGGAGGSLGAGGVSGSGGTPDASVQDAPSDAASVVPDVVDLAPDTVSSAGLVAYYPCESVSGAVLRDQSGRGNDGTIAVGPLSTGGAPGTADASVAQAFSLVDGKVGKALALSASNDGYIQLPAGMLAGANEMTVAAWVRVHSSESFMRVFDFGVDTYAFLYLTTNKGGVIHFRMTKQDSTTDAAAIDQVLDGPSMPIDEWTHLALTIGSGGVALYVNGSLAASSAPAVLRPSDLGDIANAFIGRSEFPVDPYLDGDIDEYRIYVRALDAAEIASLAGG
jgi:hypothetical protein